MKNIIDGVDVSWLFKGQPNGNIEFNKFMLMMLHEHPEMKNMESFLIKVFNIITSTTITSNYKCKLFGFDIAINRFYNTDSYACETVLITYEDETTHSFTLQEDNFSVFVQKLYDIANCDISDISRKVLTDDLENYVKTYGIK